MNLIATTQRTYTNEHQETFDALDQRWITFLNICNLIPIIVPNHLMSLQNLLKIIPIKGILLTGGNDSVERNKIEKYLFQYAITNNLPILGVCHGMQQIQRAFNIHLVPVTGHVRLQQNIFVNNQDCVVNSYHQLGTTETHPDFIVWAKAKDDVIKAIKHRNKNITGIMWHPERFQPFRKYDLDMFKKIFLRE